MTTLQEGIEHQVSEPAFTNGGMRRRSVTRRLGNSVLPVYSVLVYVFLFAPIVVVIIFSFNSGQHVSSFEGFSLRWYKTAWTDPFYLSALRNSLQIAVSAGILSAVIGTAAALGERNLSRRGQRVLEILSYVAVIVPGIVLGISLLMTFVSFSDWINPWLAYLWPTDGKAPEIGLGMVSVIAGETVFGTALVMIVVRTRLSQLDPTLQRASADLYATPVRTLFQVTLPQLASAIMGGFVLAFTFAFDDFIIAFFTRGQAQTLPIVLFSSIRRGVNPAINAIASVLVVSTVLLLITALMIVWRRQPGRTPSE